MVPQCAVRLPLRGNQTGNMICVSSSSTKLSTAVPCIQAPLFLPAWCQCTV